MNTKDVDGYLSPLAAHAKQLIGVSIPGETNTLPAEDIAQAAAKAGISASTAENVDAAVAKITQDNPSARILICGSLYLAGSVLRSHG